MSHNVHSLVYLVNDVKRFGLLDNFSAFKFENYMQILKKYIREADKPLQQVVRRYIEKEIKFITIINYFITFCSGISKFNIVAS